jgi:CDGSH-type Zn-finger protein
MDNKEMQAHIKVTPNGPYVVSGAVPLTERYPAMSVHGEPLEWDPVGANIPGRTVRQNYALCRCGNSGDKPFCDGTHARVGFDGTLTADRRPTASRRRTFVGEGVVMTDDPSLCIHIGFCTTRLSSVWQMIKHTDDPEVRARLRTMVHHCPSGRLVVSPSEDAQAEEPEFIPSVAIVPDGPLWVRGGIPVEAPDGFTYEVRNRVTLCRCGHSKNKPYCDGTHAEVGFTDR